MIKVEGHSGCSIKLKRDFTQKFGCGYLLEKSTNNPSYVHRLLKQAEKQASFNTLNSLDDVFAPFILYRRTESVEEVNATDGTYTAPLYLNCTVGMPFEHHTDAVTFLSKAPPAKLQMFALQLRNLIQQYIDRSTFEQLDHSKVFIPKLKEIEVNLAKNEAILSSDKLYLDSELFPKLYFSLSKIVNCKVPVGYCHGDLTLSNILLQPQGQDGFKLVLIDFLDSFLESPLVDLAKLAQDLTYGWTLKLHKEAFDAVRMFLILEWMQKEVFESFQCAPWFQAYFRIVFIINQLRVLQYCKKVEMSTYLMFTLREELKKM